MTSYEQKVFEMAEKSRIREEEKKQEFLSKVNQLIRSDNGWYPYISKMIETKKGYTNYTITKYPTGILSYKITFYDSNRYCGRSAEYFECDIPKVHKQQFSELEKLFN